MAGLPNLRQHLAAEPRRVREQASGRERPVIARRVPPLDWLSANRDGSELASEYVRVPICIIC